MTDTPSCLQAWERITYFHHSTRKSIHILVAYHADAAAACATLVSLLRGSLIAFTLHPIATYDEMRHVIAQINAAQDDHAERTREDGSRVDEMLILIGLGATVDLVPRYVDAARHCAIVLDAHRPVYLGNLRAEDDSRFMLWGSPAIQSEVNAFFVRQSRFDRLRERHRRRRRAQHTRADEGGADEHRHPHAKHTRRRHDGGAHTSFRDGRPRAHSPDRAGGEGADGHTRHRIDCRCIECSKDARVRRNPADGGIPDRRAHGAGLHRATAHPLVARAAAAAAEENPPGAPRAAGESGAVSRAGGDAVAVRDDDPLRDDDDGASDSTWSSPRSRCSSSSVSLSLDDEEDEEEEDEEEEEEEEEDVQSQDCIDWRSGDEAVAPYMLDRYYAAECGGRSCAVELYELATLLNRLQNSMLWRAAVGVYDLRARRLIDAGSYLLEMRPLHDAVSLTRHRDGPPAHRRSRQLNPPSHDGHASRTAGVSWPPPHSSASSSVSLLANHTEEEAAEEEDGAGYPARHDTRESAMRLHNEDEELLFLLRHTTLWNAIWLHPLLASVCGFHHKEDGTGFLAQLLASRCGVSMSQAQQPWCQLPREVRQDVLPRVRQELRRLLERHAGGGRECRAHRDRRGTRQAAVAWLTPSAGRCVTRTSGYSTPVSTGDVCALFDALLAVTPPSSLWVVEEEEEGEGQKDDGTDAGRHDVGNARRRDPTSVRDGSPAATAERAARVVQTRWGAFARRQFWQAYAVVEAQPHEEVFVRAVEAAMALQTAVTDVTAALMQPGMLQSTRGIHYAAMHDPVALEPLHTESGRRALATRLLATLTVERGVDRERGTVRPLLLVTAQPRVRWLPLWGGGDVWHAPLLAQPLPSASSLSRLSSTATAAMHSPAEDTATGNHANAAKNNNNNSNNSNNSSSNVSSMPDAAGDTLASSSLAAATGHSHTDAMYGTAASLSQSIHLSHGATAAMQDDPVRSSGMRMSSDVAVLGAEEGTEYVILLAHEGTTGATLTPLEAVGRFNRCVSDVEEFVELPARPFTQRTAVTVRGKENAVHMAELMHLVSMEPWNPRREYLCAARERARAT